MKIRIFLIFCLSFLVVACGPRQRQDFIWNDISPRAIEETGEVYKVRAAVFLPFSGKSRTIGNAFRNAAMMALQEQDNSVLELLFFDTKGTDVGTRMAWEEARYQNPDIVIGPITATEVATIADESPNAPVLSFTTDNTVLEGHIYTLGILIPNQIDYLVRHMCQNNQRKIAVIGPENKTGEIVMNHLMQVVNRCPDMTVDKIALYTPETTNFNETVLKIVPKPIDPKKKNLTEEEKILLETPIEERIDFDALLVYEDGVKLQQVISLLAYYDVTPKVVPIYGLANWQSSRDKTLVNSYFPTTPTERSDLFTKRYTQIFGAPPPRISSLAYDAVSLIAHLAKHKALTTGNLTQEKGFNGVNGRFRLLSDGTNERLLEIRQFQPGLRQKIIDPVPDTFLDKESYFVEPEPDLAETEFFFGSTDNTSLE